VVPPAVADTLRTARGEEVERLAEQFIANQLHALGLDYAYRQALPGAGQHVRVPDFTVLDAEQKRVLWFHMDESADADERDRWQTVYAGLGYEAGINLFLTRDDAQGQIDEARLRKLAAFIHSMAM